MLQEEAGPARSIATGVSYVLNPLILPPALVAILLTDAGAPPAETLRATAVVGLLLTILPLGLLGWLVRSGRASNVQIPDRRQRFWPYVCGIAGATLALMFVAESSAGPVVLAVFVCLALNTALMMWINQRWKISIHSAGAAGFLALLLVVALGTTGEAPAYLLWLSPAVPLVMWARVRSGAHTVGEVAAGASFGLLAPPLEMMLMHASGIW